MRRNYCLAWGCIALIGFFPIVSLSSALTSPVATSVETAYEGGYRIKLGLCKRVLCDVSIFMNHRVLRVADDALHDVVDPKLSEATLYLDLTITHLTSIVIEVPLADYDYNHPETRQVARIMFTPQKFLKVILQTWPKRMK